MLTLIRSVKLRMNISLERTGASQKWHSPHLTALRQLIWEGWEKNKGRTINVALKTFGKHLIRWSRCSLSPLCSGWRSTETLKMSGTGSGFVVLISSCSSLMSEWSSWTNRVYEASFSNVGHTSETELPVSLWWTNSNTSPRNYLDWCWREA